MGDPTITNIDNGDLVRQGEGFDDGLLTLAGADSIAKGTILARDSVSLKYVLFVKGGSTNENGIPKAVLMHAVVSTGAGDSPVRVLTEGEVEKGRLIIDADGDDSNIDAAVIDQLRDYGIRPKTVQQTSVLDNQ